MPTLLTGNPASGAWSPAASATCPADGDLANAASFNTPYQALLNAVAFLQAQAAQKNGSNTWPQAQTLQALLSLTAAGNALALTAAVAQSILKTAAGGLTVGTAAGGGDLTLSANGVALLKALASGSLDAQGKILGNLATPAAAADAATKAYVDARFPSLAWSQSGLFANAYFTWGTAAAAPGYWKDSAGVVHLKGALTAATGPSTSLFTGAMLPGYQPAGYRRFVIHSTNGPTRLAISNTGSLGLEDNSVVGHAYYLDGVSFVAEQ